MNPKSNAAVAHLRKHLAEQGHAAILFVCLGNICRSPAAEEIMRQRLKERGLDDKITLDSAGFYDGHRGELPDQRMRIHARRRGYELTHRSRPIRRRDYSDFDLIVGMDARNLQSLHGFAATEEEDAKIVGMTDFSRAYSHIDHIPDPYYDGAEGFENVLDLLEDACNGLADEIASPED